MRAHSGDVQCPSCSKVNGKDFNFCVNCACDLKKAAVTAVEVEEKHEPDEADQQEDVNPGGDGMDDGHDSDEKMQDAHPDVPADDHAQPPGSEEMQPGLVEAAEGQSHVDKDKGNENDKDESDQVEKDPGQIEFAQHWH